MSDAEHCGAESARRVVRPKVHTQRGSGQDEAWSAGGNGFSPPGKQTGPLPLVVQLVHLQEGLHGGGGAGAGILPAFCSPSLVPGAGLQLPTTRGPFSGSQKGSTWAVLALET